MENNSFLDSIIDKDKELLIYLNNLGSEQWDSFWLFITNQFNWIPLFVLILALIFKKFGWKKGIYSMIFVALLITFSDQFTNFIKDFTARLRPNNDPLIKDQLRRLISPGSYSFWSGHASGSTTFTAFIIFLLRNHYKHIYWLLLFPLFFAYSRLYLGVHFPIDIIVGILTGIFFGYIFYRLYNFINDKIFKEK